MDKFIIKGNKPLQGSVIISGAKNSALPILAATLLTAEPVTLHNVPNLKDINTILELLGLLGVTLSMDAATHTVTTYTPELKTVEAHYDLVKTMRASILVLGPLLARFGAARVSLPGGCAIGARPVDLHVSALQKMGAEISVHQGYIDARCDSRLHGADIVFNTVTVTGTENILMAAVLAEGQTIIRNAAREPEVVDLAHFLIAMGANITGMGTHTIIVEGVDELTGCEYSVLPDRIEAGTFLAAAAITQGDVTVKNVLPETLSSLTALFKNMGADVQQGDDWISLNMHGQLPKAVDIETAPYPGFPTDMQAQIMAVNCVAQGTGSITENIFENRFMHVGELARMGANIKIKGNTVVTQGVDELNGAPVMATDLRASAGLIIAALAANGETEIDRIYHVDRGYEHIEEKFKQLGADISRVPRYKLPS